MNRKLKARIIEFFGTQADFAVKIKVDETVVSRIIRGRKILSPEDQKKWAEVLESAPRELFNAAEDYRIIRRDREA